MPNDDPFVPLEEENELPAGVPPTRESASPEPVFEDSVPSRLPLVRSGSHLEMILEGFEQRVERVLDLPPPGSRGVDPAWADLFKYCQVHCKVLAARARRSLRGEEWTRADVWLRELAAAPYGAWGDVRYAVLPFIKLVGRIPGRPGERLFTGGTPVPPYAVLSFGTAPPAPRLLPDP